jgi:hypothetical protein
MVGATYESTVGSFATQKIGLEAECVTDRE